ncbi:MAG: LuxR C-terminal-related transcriptional regulator [Pseudomonadota bacterium]
MGPSHRLESFVESICAQQSVGTVWLDCLRYFQILGFEWVAYRFQNVESGELVGECLTNLPEWWRDRYAVRGQCTRDPFFSQCVTLRQKRIGSDYAADMADQHSEAARALSDLKEVGFRSGLASPVRVGGAVRGGWQFGTSLSRTEFEHTLFGLAHEVRVAAFSAHQMLETCRRQGAALENALSARERECLSLLADGHRTARIAERIGIAPMTVEFHLRNARRKLGATTREQAVAISVKNGFIHA